MPSGICLPSSLDFFFSKRVEEASLVYIYILYSVSVKCTSIHRHTNIYVVYALFPGFPIYIPGGSLLVWRLSNIKTNAGECVYTVHRANGQQMKPLRSIVFVLKRKESSTILSRLNKRLGRD